MNVPSDKVYNADGRTVLLYEACCSIVALFGEKSCRIIGNLSCLWGSGPIKPVASSRHYSGNMGGTSRGHRAALA